MMRKIDLSNFDGKILLTGKNGFIGKSLVNYFEKHGLKKDKLIGVRHNTINFYENYYPSVICNLTNQNSVKEMLELTKPTHIIHLAANATVQSNAIDNFYDLNLKATHYLLEHCQENTDFIFASSVLVYGSNCGGCVECDKLTPDSVYGITKVACEQLIDLYYRKRKIRPRILRLCGNVGPGMTHGKIFQACKTNHMKLYGKSPGSYLPLCHVEDSCEAIARSLISNKPDFVLNICPDDYISLEEMVLAVNPNLQIEWTKDSLKIDMLQVHNSRAFYVLDWTPKYTSKEALQKFVEDSAQTA